LKLNGKPSRKNKNWSASMSRALTTALLLAGMVIPAAAAEQPGAISHPAPGYFVLAGRSYLGVDVRDVTTDRMGELKLKEERGVEITMVDGDAPAAKAGLREHDVILDFNGTAIESEEQFRRLIREVPPGRTVSLGISRDGSPMKMTAQLADHAAVVAQKIPSVRIADFPRNGMDVPFEISTYSTVMGVQTENLTRQLGEYFGVKNGEGVLVRSVDKGSAGEKAGLKAGDIIVRADNEKLTDRMDLGHILRKHRTGGKMVLIVMRDKHEQTLTLTLPDRGSRDSSMIWLDTDGLLASLGNLGDAMKGLNLNEGWLTLQDGNLGGLKDRLDGLKWKLDTLNDKTNQMNWKEFKLMPDTQNLLDQAQELLQLNLDHDPI
jgi:serine protease Do